MSRCESEPGQAWNACQQAACPGSKLWSLSTSTQRGTNLFLVGWQWVTLQCQEAWQWKINHTPFCGLPQGVGLLSSGCQRWRSSTHGFLEEGRGVWGCSSGALGVGKASAARVALSSCLAWVILMLCVWRLGSSWFPIDEQGLALKNVLLLNHLSLVNC